MTPFELLLIATSGIVVGYAIGELYRILRKRK